MTPPSRPLSGGNNHCGRAYRRSGVGYNEEDGEEEWETARREGGEGRHDEGGG